MKRVVVTGLGIVSSIGTNKEEVRESLKSGQSGIVVAEDYIELGMRSRVHGSIKLDPKEHIDRKIYRFMGDAAAFTYIAMQEAIDDAGLSPEQVVLNEPG